MKNKYLLIGLLSVVLLSCNNNDKFTYKELNEADYQMVELADQTEVKILSFSGGKYCDKEIDYYYQFIVVDINSGDTLRILSPCQKYDFGESPTLGTFNDISYLQNVFKDSQSNLFIDDKTKMVVYNNDNAVIENRNYKTAIGSLSF